MRDRTVVLVTHHVELVLPGAQFLVRMLDGRIDLQGTLKDLRASGALSDIELEAAIEERAEAEERVADGKEDEEIEEAIVNGDGETVDKKKKKPRKLVKDEEREEGNVKWAIYKTYLKAS